MLLRFRCTNCRARIPLSDDQLRDFLICPHCGQKMRLATPVLSEQDAEALKAKADYAASFSYTVLFKPEPTRTMAAAVNLAQSSGAYQPTAPGSDGFHRVSFKPWAAASVMELVSLLSGTEQKTFFNDEEVPFQELRASLACLRARYSSRDPDAYCRGESGWQARLFLCYRSNVANKEPEAWIYSHCRPGGDGKFRLDVSAFSNMVAETLREYRYCPFAQGPFLRKAISRFGDLFEAGGTSYTKYLHPLAHADVAELRVENTGRTPLYQRVCTFAQNCVQCAAYHGMLHDGSGRTLPLPQLHEGCNCIDIIIQPGALSRGYRKLADLLPLLSGEERAGMIGEEQGELLQLGFPAEEIIGEASVKSIAELSKRLNYFAVEALGGSSRLLESLKREKGEGALKRDEKEWTRMEARMSRRHEDGAQARIAAARELISGQRGA